mmetsp:Transcript_19461/g.43370  ORF Transcript_19461/g.43370 Transcript_19461/m.43370 type:complete len:213 (+) Transcript_19461:1594-2232(+)
MQVFQQQKRAAPLVATWRSDKTYCPSSGYLGLGTFFLLGFLVLLRGQREFSTGVLADEVVVEEVDVETGLDEAAPVDDPVVLVVDLVVGPVHPVDYVERPVYAQQEHIVRCEVLDLAIPLQHYQLRHDGQRLQEDGEDPKELQQVKSLNQICDNCQHNTRSHCKFPVQKGILRTIVVGLERLRFSHHVEDESRATYVHHLHQGVVARVVRGE